MNVQNLKLQFSQLESRPTNVVRTQIPVARFHRDNLANSNHVNHGHSNQNLANHGYNNQNHVNHAFSNQNHSNHSRYGSHGHSPATSPTGPSTGSLSADRWRLKYEEAEKKRKALLTQNQKGNRDYEDLQRRFSQLQREVTSTRQELSDKDTKLNQLQQLSKAMYKEYEQLKTQYELETGTMQQAMQRASLWYKENRELKRRSVALIQRVGSVAPEFMGEVIDETDSGVCTDNDDFDDLRKSVQELNRDIARLQAEVNAAKLQEFEAQETIAELSTQLDDERNARVLLESELNELRAMRDNISQVSRLVAVEVSSLRDQCQREKETAQRMKEDADKAKKERNVLAHQSQLLMCEVAADQRLLQVVMEVENLKRTLEEEQQRHAAELQALQEKLEEKEVDGQLELLEEKLKLAEAELQCALQRAERAETISEQLSSKVSLLEEEMNSSHAAPPLPPPLPPPPPPPPLPSLAPPPPVVLRKRSTCDGAESAPSSAVLEMANLLGIPKGSNKVTAAPGAIDDIINEIKGGRFTLKKSSVAKPSPNKEGERPPVVQEMINVLGTLRKRRTPSMRRQQDKPPADVTL